MVGYDAKNKQSCDQNFICLACKLILRDPVQLSECGHRLCQSCINHHLGSIIKCPLCHTETQRTEITPDRGCINDMKSIPIDCSLCQWSGVMKDYQGHLDQSHSHPKCEYCDQQFHSVNQYNEHKLSECRRIIIACLLKDFGCSDSIMRGDMEEHYLTQQHQDTLNRIVHQMKSQILDSQMDIDPSQRTTTTTTTSSISDPATADVLELYETLRILTGGVETLNDDSQRLNDTSLQTQINTQALAEDLSRVRISVEESHSYVEGVKQNQEILEQELTSMKQSIDDMGYVSYDGTLVWKITNVREKMTDAQSERQTSIYSPPFYSSTNGYKMRARLYLNGDGNARGTHLSLFFVLMRSPNDPILKFPFTYKMTFCLYDQSGRQKHIIDSFRPDIKSNSFQRPRSEMNIASGIPKFARLDVIEQAGNPYVQDDTMFIKVMVDFGDLPKALLPFALSLNPGLPMHYQQAMIKSETELRTQQQQQQQQGNPVT